MFNKINYKILNKPFKENFKFFFITNVIILFISSLLVTLNKTKIYKTEILYRLNSEKNIFQTTTFNIDDFNLYINKYKDNDERWNTKKVLVNKLEKEIKNFITIERKNKRPNTLIYEISSGKKHINDQVTDILLNEIKNDFTKELKFQYNLSSKKILDDINLINLNNEDVYNQEFENVLINNQYFLNTLKEFCINCDLKSIDRKNIDTVVKTNIKKKLDELNNKLKKNEEKTDNEIKYLTKNFDDLVIISEQTEKKNLKDLQLISIILFFTGLITSYVFCCIRKPS